MPQVRLERLALVCAAVAVAACSKDRTSAADSAAMAPAGGAMTSDTGAMSGAAGAGAAGGAMGSATDSANRANAAGAGAAGTAAGTAAPVGNQTQSGVTNAKTGASTLGPNIKKVGPTTAADSAAQAAKRP